MTPWSSYLLHRQRVKAPNEANPKTTMPLAWLCKRSTLDAVYICYWSLKDPLCQSQSLTAVKALAKRGHKFALVTYERDPYELDERAREEERLALAREGVEWRPLRYHRWPRVIATLYDILCGVLTVSWLVFSRRATLVHGRGTVSAAVAWGAARLQRVRFFYDADGPLSDEYADIGHWSRYGPAYRMTNWAENRFLADADRVAVLTNARRKDLPLRDSTVAVLPCGVDLEQFRFDPHARKALRDQYNWNGTVFLYAGKLGGWYLGEPMVRFFSSARRVFHDARLVILTRENIEEFRALLSDLELTQFSLVQGVEHRDMSAWLSAADVALSFLLPAPAVRARSPVKNGEYLACGLPIVTTKDIGDYSTLVDQENVGVVLNEMSENAWSHASTRLKKLLSEPDLRDRCREVARRYVSLDAVVSDYAVLYDELLTNQV